tara:strand:+ start:26665 stop:27045 length:381 start_codon:yes stop_codon:yes gene_type:complete
LKELRVYLAGESGKLIISLSLIGIMLNNILIPEMESIQFSDEFENSNSGLIEVLVENATDSDLVETDKDDDSSDNLVDTLQKFLSNSLIIELNHERITLSKNQFIYPHFKLARGYQFLDTPPPKLL